MKKRNIINNNNRLGGNSRRRQLLKRVHQKVTSRRQQFQSQEIAEEFNIKTYFTTPYMSQEKGTVEKRIGVFRRFYLRKQT